MGGKMPAEYRSWRCMLDRCYKETDVCYAMYGGRGIRVCERWRDSFAAFLEDMGPKPSGFSIERINNGGSYTPANCRWASAKEQANNRRNNRVITARGMTKTLQEWAEFAGVSKHTMKHRLNSGWTIDEILSVPVGNAAVSYGRRKQLARKAGCPS